MSPSRARGARFAHRRKAERRSSGTTTQRSIAAVHDHGGNSGAFGRASTRGPRRSSGQYVTQNIFLSSVSLVIFWSPLPSPLLLILCTVRALCWVRITKRLLWYICCWEEIRRIFGYFFFDVLVDRFLVFLLLSILAVPLFWIFELCCVYKRKEFVSLSRLSSSSSSLFLPPFFRCWFPFLTRMASNMNVNMFTIASES